MAKHFCPSCGKRFDYEQHSWICPKCGTVVTGTMESEQIKRELGESYRPKEKHKPAPTVNDYDKKHGTRKYKNRTLKYTLIAVTVVLVIMLIVGIGIFAYVVNEREKDMILPEASEFETVYYLDEDDENSQEESVYYDDIEVSEALIGEGIAMDGYTLTINDVFVPEWEELPKIDGWKYIAVSYERAAEDGYISFGFSGKKASLFLQDVTEDVVVHSLYESDLIVHDDNNDTDLYAEYGMVSDIYFESGTVLFLVKETSADYKLLINEGSSDSILEYDMEVEWIIEVPFALNGQEVSSQP